MSIAIYLRLSQSDGDLGVDGKDESNSIENQRMLLQEYVEAREDLEGEIVEYVDDGYSGTNFNRPSFKRMIEDAKKGLIRVILVKDLSRLGRDYITAGDYIEQIFPLLQVRFIAVNNNYDSNKFSGGTMGFDMAVSNLINTFYSRDLSKKMKAANKTRWKNGISTSGNAPFGYIISKKEKGKWEIDPDAAAIVRIIFEKAIAGFNTTEIDAHLNENKLPTPWVYNQTHHNWKLASFNTKMEERLWDCAKVRNVLVRYDYTGAMIMGRTKVLFIGSGRKVNQPESEWTIVEGINEAIVTHEEYEQAVLAIRPQKKRDYSIEQSYPLKGKVFCGNCNRRLHYSVTTYKEIFVCRSGRQIGKHSKCCKDEYSVQHIETVVMRALKELISTLQWLGVKAGAIAKDNMVKSKARQVNIGLEIEKLNAEKIRLYERYAEQMISRDMYVQKKLELTEQLHILEESKVEQKKIFAEQSGLWETASDLTSLARGFSSEEKISRKIVEAFIAGVRVHNENKIDIEFLFEDEIQRLMNCIKNNENEDTNSVKGVV